MGKMPVTRLIFYVAVPIAVGYIVTALNTIVDSFWVSRLGADNLSAVGLATPFYMFIMFLVEAISVGATATIAKALGAGDRAKVSRLVINTFILSGIMAVAAAAAGLLLFPYLIEFQAGAEVELGELAKAYIMPFVFCAVVYAVHWSYIAFLSAAGKTRLSMIASVTGIAFNIGLTPVFLFVFNMGISGAMWATVLSTAIATAAAIVFNYVFNREVVKTVTPICFTRDARAIITFALPTFLTWVSYSVVAFITNYNVLKFGTDALEVLIVYQRFENFVLCLLWAVSGAMLSIISYNLGEKNIDRVRETMKKGIIISWLSIIPMTVVLSLLGRQMAVLLNASPSAVQMASWAVPLIMGELCLLGLRVGFEDCIKALGHPYLAMSTVLARQAVLIPLIFVITAWGTLPWLYGIWTLLELPALLYAYLVFRRTIRKVL